MEDDVLKRTFKSLKKRDADYSDVLNTECSECCQRFLHTQDLGPSDTDISSNTPCTAYSHPDYPGLYLVKGALSPARLQHILHLVLLEYPTGTSASTGSSGSSSTAEQHVRSNLSCLGTTCPEGQSYWSTTDTQGSLLIDKLRWISMGYHFDWTAREYRPGFRSSFPSELSDIACSIANRVGVGEELLPDSALINYYHPGDTLSFHQDELEWDLSKPLISISLGLPGILCVGGTDRHHTPLSLLLHHGDIIILSGLSRTAYHAVPRVFDSYSVRTCRHSPLDGLETGVGTPRWLNLFVDGLDPDLLAHFDKTRDDDDEEFTIGKKIKEFLPRTRFNISIRQVEKHQ